VHHVPATTDTHEPTHRPAPDAAMVGRIAGRRVASSSADARMRITRRARW
jgi:hypothetical protein